MPAPPTPEMIKDIFEEIENTRIMGIMLASKYVLEHRYKAAKDIFEKLLQLSPNDVEIMALYANVYCVEGKLVEAENRLNQVLLLNPNYPLALYFLGYVYNAKGEYEKAINMYEKALKFFSENEKIEKADAYQNLGCSLLAVNRREEAIEAWKTCLKYNPRQKSVKENLKNVTNEYGMAKSPVGLDDFRAFVDFKRKEYLSDKGRNFFEGLDEANMVLKKITDAWDNKIISKSGAKLHRMKTKEKVKLFKETKVF
jgi:tetratricopeptide (TPR) repeat protein